MAVMIRSRRLMKCLAKAVLARDGERGLVGDGCAQGGNGLGGLDGGDLAHGALTPSAGRKRGATVPFALMPSASAKVIEVKTK